MKYLSSFRFTRDHRLQSLVSTKTQPKRQCDVARIMLEQLKAALIQCVNFIVFTSGTDVFSWS